MTLLSCRVSLANVIVYKHFPGAPEFGMILAMKEGEQTRSLSSEGTEPERKKREFPNDFDCINS